ncbi:MAG: hypothetical protein WC641_02050 [Patescibacteria group bacterium]
MASDRERSCIASFTNVDLGDQRFGASDSTLTWVRAYSSPESAKDASGQSVHPKLDETAGDSSWD